MYGQSYHSIGLNVGTTHSFRTIRPTIQNDPLTENFILNKAEDNTKTQFTAGLTYSLKLYEMFSLNSGLQYQNLGYNAPDALFNFATDYQVPGSERTNKEDFLTIQTLGVPLTVSYDLLKTKKSSLQIGVGLTLALIFKEQHNKLFTQDSENIEIIDNIDYNYKTAQFGGIADLTYSYKITEKHSLTISPSFNFNLTPNETFFLRENLYTLRTVVGVKHHF